MCSSGVTIAAGMPWLRNRQPVTTSAEYHFLAGEYERVFALFEKKNVKKLSPKDADIYGSSLLILGDRLHSTAKAADNRAQYRSAIKRFEFAAKISPTAADALYNWGNVLFDLSLAVRDGAPEVMTRSADLDCRQTSNSVLSGGVGRQGSYSCIELVRSELRIPKDTEMSSGNVQAPSLASNNAKDRIFIDSSEV